MGQLAHVRSGMLLSLALACGSADKNGADAGHAVPHDESGVEQLLEVAGQFALSGAAEWLQVMIDLYREEHTNVRVVTTPYAFPEQTGRRLSEGNPPDLFLEFLPSRIPIYLRDYPGKIAALDDIYVETGLREAVPEEITESLTAEIDGERAVYAIPFTLARYSMLAYNARLFGAHGVDPPGTIQELLDACAKLNAAGVAPIAVSSDGFTIGLMFHSIAAGVMGADTYRAYFTGKLPANDSSLDRAIDVFAKIFDEYTKESGAVEYGEEDEELVLRDEAAMVFDGDWAYGFFEQRGWSYEIDYGMQAAPGAENLFLFEVNSWMMPKEAPHPQNARNFLTTIAAPEAQVAFNKVLGSLPARADVNESELAPIALTNLNDLREAKVRMLADAHVNPAWSDALAAYAKDHDRAKLRQTFIDAPPAAR